MADTYALSINIYVGNLCINNQDMYLDILLKWPCVVGQIPTYKKGQKGPALCYDVIPLC